MQSPATCAKLKVGKWINIFTQDTQDKIYQKLTDDSMNPEREHAEVKLDDGSTKEFGYTLNDLLPSTNHLLTVIQLTAKIGKPYRLLSVGPGYGSPDSYLPILLLDKAAATGLEVNLKETLSLLDKKEERSGIYKIVTQDFTTYEPEGSYDVVTLFNVTHFYKKSEAQGIMKHAVDALSPGGHLFFLSDTNKVKGEQFIPNRMDLETVCRDIGLQEIRKSYIFNLRSIPGPKGTFALGYMEKKDTEEVLSGISAKIFLIGTKPKPIS